jgi:hypothetical protein
VWNLLSGLGYRFEQLRPDGQQEPLLHPTEAKSPNVLGVPA